MLADPAHPGELLKSDVLPAFGLNITRAAEVLKITRANLTRVLDGKAALSHDLALKVEKAFGVSAELLTAMQNNFDLAEARRRADQITAGVERQKPATAA